MCTRRARKTAHENKKTSRKFFEDTYPENFATCSHEKLCEKKRHENVAREKLSENSLRKYRARKTARKFVRKSARKYFRVKVYSFTCSFCIYAYENIFRGYFRSDFRAVFRARYFRNKFSSSFSHTTFSLEIFAQIFAQYFRAKNSWGFSRQGIVWVVGVGVLVMWQTSYQEGYVLRGIKDHTAANRISWPCHMHHTLCHIPVTQGPRFPRMLCFEKRGPNEMTPACVKKWVPKFRAIFALHKSFSNIMNRVE